ncbi:MAG: GIY-YIG nuclease family protein [Acidobacteria bacterium]|nr:GIY-YIG nuclease family protein [Acidobacteriota bacterium]
MAAPPTIVYLLRSIADPNRYYTGLTSDLEGRLAAHNAGLSPHTADGAPWEPIVSIWFSDTGRATRFEKYLKSGSGREFARRHFR